VKYTDSSTTHTVLDNQIDDGTVEPHHPLEGDPWDAPFFYEDRRHAFFVTTDERMETIERWDDIGVVVSQGLAGGPVRYLPPLVLRTPDIIPDLGGPITRQPGFGLIDPAPARALVTEDAYITRTLGTPGTVSYGEIEIGPLGSQTKSLHR
jgi:hypothetical protein